MGEGEGPARFGWYCSWAGDLGCVETSASVPAPGPCPGPSAWWTVKWKWKPSKAFPPQAGFIIVMGKLTKELSSPPRPAAPHCPASVPRSPSVWPPQSRRCLFSCMKVCTL